jgi:hypothetical protein
MSWNGAMSCLAVLLHCLLWCAGPVSAATQGAEKREYGIVELLVLDTYGKPLRSFEGVISSEDADALSRKVRAKAETVTLPYGAYVIRGRASLHNPVERRFWLKEPRLLVVVALSFHDPGEFPWVYAPPLKVCVRNLPLERGRVWVRFVSLLGDFAKEVVMERSGEGSINEVPSGDYVVLVFQDSQLLKTAHFRRTLREAECFINLEAQIGPRK